jgi:hypothetical protein
MTQRRSTALAKLILTAVAGSALLAGCGGYGFHRHHDGRYYPPTPPVNAGPSSPPAPLPPPPRPRL